MIMMLKFFLQGGVKQHRGLELEQVQQVEQQQGGCLTSARYKFQQTFWQVCHFTDPGDVTPLPVK